MNEILQARCTRLETALNTLIDSITSYNPSIAAADELLDADAELSHGFELRNCLLLVFTGFKGS